MMFSFVSPHPAVAFSNLSEEEYNNYKVSDFLVELHPLYEINCVEHQLERLLEILESAYVTRFTLDGESVTAPSISMVMPPGKNRDYFIIGLDDVPTQENIDFILSFTGIPSENACIGQWLFEPARMAVFEPENVTRTYRQLDRFVDADGVRFKLCPDGYAVRLTDYAISPNEEEYQEIMPLATWSFGRPFAIFVLGRWYIGTIGHPTCVNGTHFVTALHGYHFSARNRPVYQVVYVNFTTGALELGPQIGVVDGTLTFNQPHRDVARVNMIGQHRIMPFVPSTPSIPGAMISNFGTGAGAEPRPYQSVISVRGISGMQTTWIDNVFWRSPGGTMTERIAIYPVRVNVGGDSGAALIRREFAATERTVLGTHQGVFRCPATGREIGVYTRVSSYGF